MSEQTTAWTGPRRVHWRRDGRGMTGYVKGVISAGARAQSGTLLSVYSNGRVYRVAANELLPEAEAYKYA
jgi:hypothetical protein